MNKILVICAIAMLAPFVMTTASAQDPTPPPSCEEEPERLGCNPDSPDPSCEEDPEQLGCEPECADESVDCHHPPCPTSLHGQALPNGEIFMSWTLNSLDDVKVYRAEGDGEFVLTDIHAFPRTKHLDQDAEAGVTYRYQVTAINETGVESPACETIEVTAIPVFPSTVAAGLAAGVGIVAYAGLRRRN